MLSFLLRNFRRYWLILLRIYNDEVACLDSVVFLDRLFYVKKLFRLVNYVKVYIYD